MITKGAETNSQEPEIFINKCCRKVQNKAKLSTRELSYDGKLVCKSYVQYSFISFQAQSGTDSQAIDPWTNTQA